MKGLLGLKLLAVVAEGKRERVYLDPLQLHEEIAATLKRPTNIDGIDAPIGLDKRAIWCLLYGLATFDTLFTARQLVALTTMSDLVGEVRNRILKDSAISDTRDDDRPLAEGGRGSLAYADGIATYLGMMVSRHANYCSTICVWSSHAKDELAKQVFLRQGIPMTWDFAETNPFASSGGTIGRAKQIE
jgi:putative DNA methylase